MYISFCRDTCGVEKSGEKPGNLFISLFSANSLIALVTQIKRNNFLLDRIVLSLSLIGFVFWREQNSMKCVSVIAVSSVSLN